MAVWEAGQRLKLEQTRWISNLLVYTGKTYIAVASQDKVGFCSSVDEDDWKCLNFCIFRLCLFVCCSRYLNSGYVCYLQIFGTGWRKNRDEANKPIFWDGENQGGKALMRLRQEIKETHSWSGPYEEQASYLSLLWCLNFLQPLWFYCRIAAFSQHS